MPRMNMIAPRDLAKLYRLIPNIYWIRNKRLFLTSNEHDEAV